MENRTHTSDTNASNGEQSPRSSLNPEASWNAASKQSGAKAKTVVVEPALATKPDDTRVMF